jgi:DNA gyrase subunit A
MTIVKGPDFPTGAMILGRKGIEDAYRTGRGKIIVRAVTRIETLPNGKTQILVSELPYLVNKARLIESIADLVRNKKIDGITALNDHSSREGMEICIEVRRDANANVILNQLYKHTQLQDTFGVINLALVNGEPKVLTLKDILVNYLIHQEDVVTRRTKYDLNKAEERAHILEGLLIALDNIDEVIRIIRASENVQKAKEELIKRFGLTDAQAQAIVDMRLRALTGLERGKIEAEYKELMERIANLREILADKNKLLSVIKKELEEVSAKYGDERRTQFGFDEHDISVEDMIPDEPVIVTATQLGYIKRMTVDNFRNQNRGGRGIKGMQTIEDDAVADVMMTMSHDTLLFFTNKGRAYRLKAYELPEASRTARGTALVNLLMLQPDEHVTTVIPIRDFHKEHMYLVMATKEGLIKRTELSAFANVRKTGIIAITLREGDELIEVKFTDGNQDIFMVSKKGMCIRFHEDDVRPTGRSSMGVRGMDIGNDDIVVSMQLAVQGDFLLCISEKGLGKRTKKDEFKAQTRGGKGVKCYKTTEKTGDLVGAKMVIEENEVLLITTEGIMIRTSVDMISVLGRNTSGVKVMNLEEGIKVASFTKVKNDDSQNEEVDSSESGTEELSEDVPDETDDVETGEIETDNVDSEDEVQSEDTVE